MASFLIFMDQAEEFEKKVKAQCEESSTATTSTTQQPSTIAQVSLLAANLLNVTSQSPQIHSGSGVSSSAAFSQPSLPIRIPSLPSSVKIQQTPAQTAAAAMSNAGVRGVAMLSPLDDDSSAPAPQNLEVRSMLMPVSNPRLVNPYVSAYLFFPLSSYQP